MLSLNLNIYMQSRVPNCLLPWPGWTKGGLWIFTPGHGWEGCKCCKLAQHCTAGVNGQRKTTSKLWNVVEVFFREGSPIGEGLSKYIRHSGGERALSGLLRIYPQISLPHRSSGGPWILFMIAQVITEVKGFPKVYDTWAVRPINQTY